MKKLLVLLFSLVVSVSAQEMVINNFDQADADTNYFLFFDNDGADSLYSYMNTEFITSNVQEGAAAMKVTYSAHNTESWGGFVKLEHWYNDSTGVYDWSLYDTLSIWYNTTVAADLPGRVHLRINLHDVSDSPTGNQTYDVGDVEYYYSFHYILDAVPGWHEIKIPLENNYNWDGNGFNLTGWSGITGNQELDKDKIKGFSFEVSINGGGEGDHTAGEFILDHMVLKGITQKALVFFNGAAIPGGVELYGGWGGGGYEITDEEDYATSTKSIKWITPPNTWAVWDGLVWTLPEVENMGFHWTTDSVKFAIKAPAGFGQIKVAFGDDDIDGFVDANSDGIDDTPDVGFEAEYLLQEAEVGFDGGWKLVQIPLRNFNRFAGGWDGGGTRPGEFDSTRVSQLKILVGSEAGIGKIVYLDNIWTGSPYFDVVAPQPPGFVAAAPGQYVNLITWTDVPGESLETYDVYYSLNPITDINGPGIEVVAMGIAEDAQLATHTLRTPLTDQAVTYYYAVVCQDAAGNRSEVALANPASVTNNGKGVAVISQSAPAFVADGSLTEWTGIQPFRMFPSDGSGHPVTNTTIDGDADLSLNVYVAMDNDYMYVAFDVFDDVLSIDTTIASYLTDGCDMFFGLYNWHGASHTSYQRGWEPDYQYRFTSTGVRSGNPGDIIIVRPGENFIFFDKGIGGYTIEAKIALSAIAAVATPDDQLYIPDLGHRIPIDFSVNDADLTGSREGILCYSAANEDLSWRDVNRWLYTWVGNSMVSDVEGDLENLTFELNQNYPNPFNPATTIRFSIPDQQFVSLKIFNILGQQVSTLVNEVKNAGVYQVNFDASKLSSGVYFYTIEAGSNITTKKMMLVK